MRQEIMGFWDAVASAGPYANNVHLAPDRQPHQHPNVQFLQAGCSSWRPTNRVSVIKALKATLPISVKYSVKLDKKLVGG